jgi:hypothetical protein
MNAAVWCHASMNAAASGGDYMILPPPVKTRHYELRAKKNSLRFIVNSIHIYGSKSIYYENIFHN